MIKTCGDCPPRDPRKKNPRSPGSKTTVPPAVRALFCSRTTVLRRRLPRDGLLKPHERHKSQGNIKQNPVPTVLQYCAHGRPVSLHPPSKHFPWPPQCVQAKPRTRRSLITRPRWVLCERCRVSGTSLAGRAPSDRRHAILC